MDKMELRRPQQAAPTEPGWYYGCFIPAPGFEPDIFFTAIVPWEVCGSGAHLEVVEDDGAAIPLNKFRWFGPVPTCVEATVPA